MQYRTPHGMECWEEVQKLFKDIPDDDLADYVIGLVEKRSPALREKLLMAITLLESPVVDQLRKQSRNQSTSGAAYSNPYYNQGNQSPASEGPLKHILVYREVLTHMGSGGVVGHRFGVSSAANPTLVSVVTIAGPQPSCNCVEFSRTPGFCCSHILFVYVHVLRNPQAQQLYRQLYPHILLPEAYASNNANSSRECCICFKPSVGDSPVMSNPCGRCFYHELCLQSWRLAAKVVSSVSCPCHAADLTTQRILQGEGTNAILVSPVKFIV